MKNSLKFVLAALFIIGLVGNSQAMFDRSESFGESNKFWENNTQTGVTMRSFKRMKIGMTFRACNNIIGFEGTVMTRSVGGGKVFTSVKWEGPDYAIITAVFRDNILTNKYQANLP